MFVFFKNIAESTWLGDQHLKNRLFSQTSAGWCKQIVTECFLTIHVSISWTCLRLILRRFKRKLPVYTGVHTTFNFHRLISSAFKWRSFFNHVLVAQQQVDERSQGELQFKTELTCSSFFRCCRQQWRVHTFHVSVSGRRQEQTDLSLVPVVLVVPFTNDVIPLFGINL